MNLTHQEQEHLLNVLLEHVQYIDNMLRLLKGRRDKANIAEHLNLMLEKHNALLRKVRSSLVYPPQKGPVDF